MNRWFVAWVMWSCAGLAGAAPSSPAAPALGCLVEPDRVADLGSPVIGVLDGLRVDRGDVVRKGQVLAVLRSDVERATAEVARTRAMAEADLNSAEANRDFARQKLKRAEDLVARNFLAQQALDQARTELQVSEQKFQQAREQQRVWGRELGVAQAQVGLRSIRSPFDGVVVERYLAQGERVEEKPIFKIARIDPLRVEVIVPAARFGSIRAGDLASVAPDLPNTPPQEAAVTLVDKVVDAASNTFRVRLHLPNPNNRLPAGLRCRITFAEPTPSVPAAERRLQGGLRLESTLSTVRPKPRP
ncbi:MAG: efflux RND transporter periplasmic adaptor subunit [Zoogloea sp.]|uniref:efflux RND transporter periplasmic adaptor subunit n=1 Tax=Zoogloea sp. TaxID=49181 RepID=UPI002601E1F1|nr:efflux RND transporter periplasmic adaptor subunit [Zoogloea sp.]MDD2990285.1 efflux RND transporter periplasmic adaptor subunit [Zoogloea sp.]